jgi:hypothetical protein
MALKYKEKKNEATQKHHQKNEKDHGSPVADGSSK